jgi:hypothetical protein
MMKRISILSLVVIPVLIFSFSGCQKAEQQSGGVKSAGQTSAVDGFLVINGTLEKGGLGYILSSDKGKVAIAIRQLDPPFKNIMKVKGRIKSAVPSGTRNGFITFRADFGDEKEQGAKAGILMANQMYTIGGAFVEEVAKPDKFDQDKVFDFDLTVNLKEKNVAFAVDGKNIVSRMTKTPVSITDIGFVNSGTKTEFSDLQISGD